MKLVENHWRKYHSDHPKDQVIVVKEWENPDDVVASLIIVNEEGKETCKICGIYQHRSDLIRHIDARHIKGAKYNCGDCSDNFTSKTSQQVHLRICNKTHFVVKEWENPEDVIASLMQLKPRDPLNRGRKSSRKDGGRGTCTICGTTQSKSDLIRHIAARHVRGAIYKCGDCSDTFKSKISQEIHFKTCIKKEPMLMLT